MFIGRLGVCLRRVSDKGQSSVAEALGDSSLERVSLKVLGNPGDRSQQDSLTGRA